MTGPSMTLDLFPRACATSRHTLLRLHTGEITGDSAVELRAHVSTCAVCKGRIRAFDAETQAAREAVPFDKLVNERLRRAEPRRFAPWMGAVAASLVLAMVVPGLMQRGPAEHRNGTKGGAGLSLEVGGVGDAHHADGDVSLKPGERVRLRYQADGHPFVLVLSIDEQGQVTPLYPQVGQSLPAEPGGALLPQSVAFDGSGRERLIAVFSDEPLPVEKAVKDARAAFDKAGSLSSLGTLGVGAEEAARTVQKPERP